MIQKNETVAVGWCDNGTVDGKFVEGLMGTSLAGKKNNINITKAIRIQGNQIGRQRQMLFDEWADNVKTDWLLWVDSDIVINLPAMEKIWNAADKNSKTVVSGIYFISKENEKSMMMPLPSIFKDKGKFEIEYMHPLPENQIIECDLAGMGFVIMHKSIISKIRKVFKDTSIFGEKEGIDNEYISEDIVFFRNLKNAGIQLYAHTGAIVRHMKRFSLDYYYYYYYWTHPEIQENIKKNTIV